MPALQHWQNFYVIVGSSAGALIGLQFVVISLISTRSGRADSAAGSAFSSPNIVHFCSVLALSGILSAPWDTIGPVAILWGLLGLGGLAYVGVVIRRMRSQDAYDPVFEDWLFHALLPIAAYATLAAAAAFARARLREALFAVSAAALLLLFVGIHNAWDAVTWHVFKPKP